MKKSIFVFVFLFVALTAVMSQNILVLEKPGIKKNYKYNKGDKIELRTADSVSVKGMITAITDTTIILDFYTEIKIRHIIQISRPRWGVSILSSALLYGGIGLLVVEALNGALSNSGTINSNVLYGGAVAAAAGALMFPLHKARFPITKDKWRLKVLEVEKEFNYQKNKPIKF
jgi:hypothetical protein